MWAEISLKAILHNLRVVRSHIGPKPKILAVVKSNAYGLGAVPISKTLQKAGVEWFGVTCANEGMELRESGIRKPHPGAHGFLARRRKATDSESSDSHSDPCGRLAPPGAGSEIRPRTEKVRVRFHLKINTGMNRLGIEPAEIDDFASALADCRHIQLEGTLTHFASAEDFTARQTDEQEKLFRACLDEAARLGRRARNRAHGQ